MTLAYAGSSLSSGLRRGYRAAVIVAVLSLAGCGFHLRGSNGTDRLPPQMARTYLQISSPYGPLAVELRRALQRNGAKISRSPLHATGVLAILQDSEGRRVLSVTPTGQDQEYELAYTVRFELRDAAGKVLVPPQTVQRTRDFLFDEAAVLGMDQEQEMLYSDMRHDIAQDIVRRLAVH
ncbi:MAG: LPS-assembly lipoprotein LptE [Gammaproteobacteria bacterium]